MGRGGYLDDVRQIKEVLTNLDSIPLDCNKQVGAALVALKNEIARQSLQQISKEERDSTPYSISVMLLAMGEKFTPQAKTEFAMLENSEFKYANVPINVTVMPIFLDDLLEEIWSQRNDDWKDRKGTKKDKVVLNVVGDVIKDAKSAIFYAKAYDFVEAFDSLGYQIFEPNVRSEIKSSKVNQAIRDTVSTRAGRRDFIFDNLDFDPLVQRYSTRNFDKNDLIIVLFAAFEHCVAVRDLSLQLLFKKIIRNQQSLHGLAASPPQAAIS
jgi:hypothetical protein